MSLQVTDVVTNPYGDIWGGAGNDTIEGGDGNNKIRGNDGNDIIRDGAGDDDVHGGAGHDIFYMGTGSDRFDGGEGIDTLHVNLDEYYLIGDNINFGIFPVVFNTELGSQSRQHNSSDVVINVETIH